MEKVKVRICLGTSCFVMGASQIQELEFNVPEDIAGKIELVEERCMKLCDNVKDKYVKGPFVMVNDELIEEATYETVINKVRQVLQDNCQ